MTTSNVCQLRIGDGRDEVHERCHESMKENVPAPDHLVVIDDREHTLGFAGAIARGFREVLQTGAEWCFWVEMDFLFLQPVPIDAMRDALQTHPYLVQMALLRQPWNGEEQEAGGIPNVHPEDYHLTEWRDHSWLEHRRFFTTNPCLVPTWVMRSGWPQMPQSEGHFGIQLFASNLSLKSAFWGEGEEWVEHIGERVGVGY